MNCLISPRLAIQAFHVALLAPLHGASYEVNKVESNPKNVPGLSVGKRQPVAVGIRKERTSDTKPRMCSFDLQPLSVIPSVVSWF